MSRIDKLSLELLIVGDSARNKRRPYPLQHLVLGTLHNAHVREHELGVGEGSFRRITMNDHRPQIAASLPLDEPRSMLRRRVLGSRLAQSRVDAVPNRLCRTGHCERRKRRAGIFRRFWLYGPETISKSLRDLPGMS